MRPMCLALQVHRRGDMAQLVERCVRNAEVTSSNLVISTMQGTAQPSFCMRGDNKLLEIVPSSPRPRLLPLGGLYHEMICKMTASLDFRNGFKLCQVLGLSREEFIGTAGGADHDSDRPDHARHSKKQTVFTILIAVISAVALIMTIITVPMGLICLTSNTGDMMDNSYSIPQYAFYVVLAVSVILILIDVGIIILKIRDKHKRS